jgi:NAD(P)H-hydrate epimerase
MKLVTAEQMRELDRVSIEERGIPGMRLMEHAGRAIALDVAEHFDTGSVAVLCGRGNNAGDGFVAGRYLCQAGWRVDVLYVSEPEPGSGDARTAWERMPEAVARRPWDAVGDLVLFLQSHDVAIDALLGTGAKGRPRPPFDALVQALNEARLPVFAADIPTGLHPDEGTADLAVRAFRTITMGLPKLGMVTADGPEYCGGVRVEPLDFPADLLESVASPYSTMTLAEGARLLPDRPSYGHKGTFGTLLLAAGSREMPGAATLCSMGALRGGCGLVRVLAPESVTTLVAGHLPEVILSDACKHLDHLHPLSDEDWDCLLARTTAVAVGPAITTSDDAAGFLAQLLDRAGHLPMILDADAITLVATRPELARRLQPHHVLTPHPGEMGRLLGCEIKEVQANRWKSAADGAKKYGCVIVLKGAGTLVAEPDGGVTHVPSGNSTWGRGGAGDVLTGLTGSLLAQGCEAAPAAKLAVLVHAMAADIYVRRKSPRGATITDVVRKLPEAFRELEDVLRNDGPCFRGPGSVG